VHALSTWHFLVRKRINGQASVDTEGASTFAYTLSASGRVSLCSHSSSCTPGAPHSGASRQCHQTEGLGKAKQAQTPGNLRIENSRSGASSLPSASCSGAGVK
ncbi:mCG146359, partial [Mus musculus]